MALPAWRSFALALAALAVASWSIAAHAQAEDFEVRQGYLSASVRTLVDDFDWSLVWKAKEDRMVDFPFTIARATLQDALVNLLEPYRGQFVADLYQRNRVVVIDTPPPRVRVLLPGEETAEPQTPDLAAAEEAAGDAELAPAVRALAQVAEEPLR